MSHDFAEQPVELVAIINSFNRRSLLERAIRSLSGALRSAQFGSAIVVFEAGSTDGSAEFLRTWDENHPADNLMLIEPAADHRSFSAGVNAACSAALARFRKCRWLFLYETDNCLANVEPLEKAISLLELEKFMTWMSCGKRNAISHRVIVRARTESGRAMESARAE